MDHYQKHLKRSVSENVLLLGFGKILLREERQRRGDASTSGYLMGHLLHALDLSALLGRLLYVACNAFFKVSEKTLEGGGDIINKQISL